MCGLPQSDTVLPYSGPNAEPFVKDVYSQHPTRVAIFAVSTLWMTERREDIAGEGMEMRGATIKVLLVVATCMSSYGKVAAEGASFAEKGRLTSLERPIRLMIAYLLACSVLGDSPTDIEQCFISLAIGSDVENAEVLVTTYAGKIVEDMSEVQAWRRSCSPTWTKKRFPN